MNSINQKSAALLQVDEFGFGSAPRKPSLERQASDNAQATQGPGADGLMNGTDKRALKKQVLITLLVSAAVVFLFIQGIKGGLIKL